ncbi:MAG: hypothetical protein WA057_01200 [Candidatus Magasanikiibacteriota bacterium]
MLWKQYLISFFVGLITVASLLLFIFFPVPLIFIINLIVWVGLSGFFYWHLYHAKENFFPDLALLIATQLSIVGLLLLVEWPILNWILLALGTGFMMLFFIKSHLQDIQLSYEQKPIRRMKMMLWVFDMYVFFTLIFAFDLFFPNLPFWLWMTLSGVVSALISVMIWKMYFAVEYKKILLWAVLMAFLVLEVVWVINLLPMGYLVLGTLITWLWFLFQLFVRFHLAPQGIDWKRQTWFLLSNIILFFIFLSYIVRWI